MWNVEQYEKFKDQRSQPFYDLVDLIQAENIRTAVDLGCGTGELTRFMHEELFLDYTLGIDSSTEMLEKSDQFASEQLKFKRVDIAQFRPEQKFDLVFSNAALQWLPDHRSLIPKVASWVNDGGQIAIQVPANHDHISHVVADVLAAEKPFSDYLQGYVRTHSVLDVRHYASILFELGFEQQNVFTKVYAHPMSSGQEVIEWIKGTGLTDYKKRMSEEQYKEYLAVYTERLISEVGAGPYFYGFKRTLMWGAKN